MSSPRIGVEVVKPLAEILNVPSVLALISKSASRKIGSETGKPSRVGAGLTIAVDLNAQRLEDALTLGATHVIKGDEQYAYKVSQEIVPGGIDFALECIGKPKVLRQAVDALKPMGTCGLLGVSSPGTEVSIEMIGLLQGRRLMGIIEGDSDPQEFVPRMIEMYRAGTFPFDKLVSFIRLITSLKPSPIWRPARPSSPSPGWPQTKSRSSENGNF